MWNATHFRSDGGPSLPITRQHKIIMSSVVLISTSGMISWILCFIAISSLWIINLQSRVRQSFCQLVSSLCIVSWRWSVSLDFVARRKGVDRLSLATIESNLLDKLLHKSTAYAAFALLSSSKSLMVSVDLLWTLEMDKVRTSYLSVSAATGISVSLLQPWMVARPTDSTTEFHHTSILWV